MANAPLSEATLGKKNLLPPNITSPWSNQSVCKHSSTDFLFVALVWPRLRTPDNYRRSFQDYVSRSKYQAAARVWAEGVPWQEAMVLAEKAIEKAFPGHGKAKGKGAKGKGGPAVPKAKGKGRGRG